MIDITFDGVQLNDNSNIYVADDSEWYAIPERNYTAYSIAGRSGDLLQDNGKYNNIERAFKFDLIKNGKALPTLEANVASKVGYKELRNSDDPNCYCMAAYEGIERLAFGQLKMNGSVEILFNCKPQKFLDSGNNAVTAGSSSSPVRITNPTGYTAKPLIRMLPNSDLELKNYYGGFRLQMGNITEVSSSITYALIDCETLEVYNGTINLAPYLTIVGSVVGNESFPFLEGNTSYDLIDRGTAGSTVYPRWWKL